MSAAPKLHSSATLFVVADVVRAVEHYRDALGFQTEFVYGEPTFYAGVERDSVMIHLQAAKETKRLPGQGSIYVFVTEVDLLHEDLKKRGAKIVQPPKDYAYGMRDFNVEDLDGNSLCFGQETAATKA